MEEGLRGAKCYNDAAYMLRTPAIGGAQIFSREVDDHTVRDRILDAAITSLNRCTIVDLFDVTHDEDWGAEAPTFLSAWFPWLGKQQAIPVKSPENTNPTHQSQRLPHRFIKVLEELNDLDIIIYREALQLMRMQKRALAAKSNTGSTSSDVLWTGKGDTSLDA